MFADSSDGEAPCSSATHRNPAAADGRGLLEAFCAKQSTKYGDFKQSWLDLQFSFVYCSGGDQPRREEIATTLYVEGMRYLSKASRPDHERLAGLYLVYTVYSTQPVEPKALIRLTLDDWSSLMQLQEIIRQKEYLEAAYILKYLRRQQAFTITFTSEQKCLCPSSGDHTSEQLYRTFLTSPRSLNPQFLSSLSQDIQQSIEDYQSAKEEMKVFFPQHLLNPQKLPEQLNKIMEEYNASVTAKFKKFRDS